VYFRHLAREFVVLDNPPFDPPYVWLSPNDLSVNTKGEYLLIPAAYRKRGAREVVRWKAHNRGELLLGLLCSAGFVWRKSPQRSSL
jgi:hypothetical protein